MSSFICPVCKNELKTMGHSCLCKKKHSYDISKKGYINLLMSQTSKTKNHGDDSAMVRARRDFLCLDCYLPLCRTIPEEILKQFKLGGTILDAGCGEGYYTEKIFESLRGENLNPQILAVDISKNALELLKNNDESLKRAVASIFNLPIADKSVDLLLNIFAPYCFPEYLRVLKKDGIMILAIPLERHLYSLKAAVYDKPYENAPHDMGIKGFSLLNKRELKYKFILNKNEDIKNLFTMTPYYHKTSPMDLKKLDIISSMEIEAEFGILVYKKL
ncbi:MAG: methyltransferase domain-containing protein [Oscillospiraceae bacterium]